MHHIGILTCENVPDLASSDKLLADYLAQNYCKITPLVWTNNRLRLSDFDALLVRSVWDYHLLPEIWMEFLDQVEQSRVQILNPLSVLRWNSNKKYLSELLGSYKQLTAQVLEAGSSINLYTVMKKAKWDKVVLKPTISASGYKTWTCELNQAQASQERFMQMLEEHELIIQEFAEEILHEGEWSLIFFNKEYSHSVLKRAKRGDFRVQSDYGGTVEVREAPAEAKQTAQEILRGLPEQICYARVDGIMRENEFYLMELELIEPELFLELVPGTEKRFAQVLLNQVQSN